MPKKPEVTSVEMAAYEKVVEGFPERPFPAGLAYLDIDAFADGVIAHKMGKLFHENPDGPLTPTVRRLSWALGWNERAIQKG